MSVCLSLYLSVFMSFCLYVCLLFGLFVCLSVYLSLCLSVCQSVFLYVCLSVSLSVCLLVSWSVCLSICLSVGSVCKCFELTQTITSVTDFHRPDTSNIEVELDYDVPGFSSSDVRIRAFRIVNGSRQRRQPHLRPKKYVKYLTHYHYISQSC